VLLQHMCPASSRRDAPCSNPQHANATDACQSVRPRARGMWVGRDLRQAHRQERTVCPSRQEGVLASCDSSKLCAGRNRCAKSAVCQTGLAPPLKARRAGALSSSLPHLCGADCTAYGFRTAQLPSPWGSYVLCCLVCRLGLEHGLTG
jgi:hypothetical protein